VEERRVIFSWCINWLGFCCHWPRESGCKALLDRGQYPVCKISEAKRTVSGSLGLDVKVRKVLKLLEKPWSPFDAIAESFEIF